MKPLIEMALPESLFVQRLSILLAHLDYTGKSSNEVVAIVSAIFGEENKNRYREICIGMVESKMGTRQISCVDGSHTQTNYNQSKIRMAPANGYFKFDSALKDTDGQSDLQNSKIRQDYYTTHQIETPDQKYFLTEGRTSSSLPNLRSEAPNTFPGGDRGAGSSLKAAGEERKNKSNVNTEKAGEFKQITTINHVSDLLAAINKIQIPSSHSQIIQELRGDIVGGRLNTSLSSQQDAITSATAYLICKSKEPSNQAPVLRQILCLKLFRALSPQLLQPQMYAQARVLGPYGNLFQDSNGVLSLFKNFLVNKRYYKRRTGKMVLKAMQAQVRQRHQDRELVECPVSHRTESQEGRISQSGGLDLLQSNFNHSNAQPDYTENLQEIYIADKSQAQCSKHLGILSADRGGADYPSMQDDCQIDAWASQLSRFLQELCEKWRNIVKTRRYKVLQTILTRYLSQLLSGKQVSIEELFTNEERLELNKKDMIVKVNIKFNKKTKRAPRVSVEALLAELKGVCEEIHQCVQIGDRLAVFLSIDFTKTDVVPALCMELLVMNHHAEAQQSKALKIPARQMKMKKPLHKLSKYVLELRQYQALMANLELKLNQVLKPCKLRRVRLLDFINKNTELPESLWKFRGALNIDNSVKATALLGQSNIADILNSAAYELETDTGTIIIYDETLNIEFKPEESQCKYWNGPTNNLNEVGDKHLGGFENKKLDC
ncbi:UNKNOWN [Stylonychia lemnae]|uniref:Uncharacterized protein n=1 Tax=Stylonychia lemnae TaxID=5949 RepID=A0A078AE82_STYLE|nr:UNKNOWN [Stylonychia lemnae]|eukprot:CDW79812.1 UNKNOWN [Stylonychia lemnae]